jgi:hypothetical protein
MGLRVRSIILLGLAACWCVPRAHAQVVEVGAVDSTLFNAQGGSLRMYLPKSESMFSFGLIDNRPVFGVSQATTIHDVDVVAGDQFLSAPLSADFLSGGYGFASRGVSIHHQRERECNNVPKPAARGGPSGYTGVHCSGHDLFAFIGRSAVSYGLPQLSTTDASRGAWLGLFRYERSLGPKLTFSTLEVHTEKASTAIQSLAWQVRPDLRIAVSGGVGANAPYASAAMDFRRSREAFRIAYGAAGRDFRLVAIPNQLNVANSGLNAQGIVQPASWLTLSGGHVQYAVPQVKGKTTHSIVDNVGATEHFGKVELHQAAFHGSTSEVHTTGAEAGATLELGLVSVHSDWFRSSGYRSTWIHALDFRINQRLTLTQYVTQTHDKISASWGGSYTGNRIVVSVGYNEQFFPVAGIGKNPFHSVLSISFSVHVKDVNVTVATVETPGQQTRWTAFGSSFIYGPYDGRHQKNFLGGKYIIAGHVTTTTGEKVQGAAILLTDKKRKSVIVYSDSQGHFEQRVRSAKDEYTVAVLLEEFTSQELYKVAECPAKATAVKEGQGEVINIVLYKQ